MKFRYLINIMCFWVVIIYSGCCTYPVQPSAVFLRKSDNANSYKLYITSIFELERYSKTGMGAAIAACNSIKESHANDSSLVKEMELRIDKYEMYSKIQMQWVEKIADMMENGDRLYWFNYKKEDKIETGYLILSPKGEIIYRELGGL